jgi:hypothetical protein
VSCQQAASRVALHAAPRTGISPTDSQTGFVTGHTPQRSFFALTGDREPVQRRLPSQRQIQLARDFSPEELQQLSVRLKLGGAATRRQVGWLKAGADRGIGHSDPRPLDWARLDLQQYEFLTDQVDRARRGKGYLDTSSLKGKRLRELGEFARFEADRALRNIDHLQAGLSHLRGATADYMTDKHRLEARFYTFLAEQVEAVIALEKQRRKS